VSGFIKPFQSNEAGISVAHELLEKLSVSMHQLVEEAYIDLLAKLPNEA
jgi:hypothetical protein